MAGPEFYDFEEPEHAKVKPEFSLLPQGALREIAVAFAMNKEKHGGDHITRSESRRTIEGEFNALMRHWFEYEQGYRGDVETGLNPAVHLAARALTLCHLALREDS